MDITYKTATASEIEPIFQQSKQLIDTYEDINTIDYTMVMDWMRRKITKKIDEYQVVYADGKKAGYYRFCRNQDGVLEIDDLYIFPEFQSKGIGTKVFQRCCDGVTEPIMFYVFKKNTRAISLYKRLGFSICEKVGETRYIMRREPMNIHVRPYEDADFDAISRIHDDARKVELSLANLDDAFLPFTIASEREDFFDYPHIDVAVIDNTVVGFTAYTEEELAWLYVSTDLFRKKIGSALVKHALETEPSICEIEVLVGNEPAKNLYETFGFSLREIVKGVMPGNESFPVQVYCMSRNV